MKHRGSRARPLLLRRLALLTAGVFGWTFCLAAPVAALVKRPDKPKGTVRPLTEKEMKRIVGSQKEVSLAGHAYPWDASVDGVDMMFGNKLTAIPIVSWQARGGMAVNLTLYHNSQGTENAMLGPKWTHSYDIYLTLDGSYDATIHWGDGRQYQFIYNMGDTYTAPAGINETLVKNGGDSTYTLTTHDHIVYHFKSSGAHHCDTITDLNSNVITLNYTSDVLMSISDPTSRAITLSYASGLLTGVSDPLTRTWTLGFTSGQLTSVSLPTLAETIYAWTIGYDTGNDINSLETPGGNTYSYTYQTVVFDEVTNYTGVILTATDGAGNETDFALSTEVSGSGTGPSYQDSGWWYTNEMTVTDPNSNQSRFHFYNYKMDEVTDADSNVTHIVYGSNLDKTQVTTARGYSWNMTYLNGNCTSVADNYNNTTLITWSEFYNKPTQIILPTLESVELDYDDYGNLQYRKSFAIGNFATGHGLELPYFNLGTLESTSQTAYNGYGELTDYWDGDSTGPTSHHYQYGHDTNGYTNQLTTPGSKVWAWTFDALGFCTSRTDGMSRETTYSPDAWERLVTTTYPDSTTHTFQWDQDNNLKQFVDGTGTTNRTYDRDDRILTETKDTPDTEVDYTWDGSGQKGLLSSVEYTYTVDDTSSSRSVVYAYTDRNQLYTVTEGDSTSAIYTYDEDMNEHSYTASNGIVSTRTYDQADRVTDIKDVGAGPTTLFEYNYTRDADGRISSEQDSSDVEDDDLKLSFPAYDWGGRVTDEQYYVGDSLAADFKRSFDNVGNLTSEDLSGTTIDIARNADDEYTAFSIGITASFSYNDNGEQTGRASSTLAYDYDGQLLSITSGDAVTSFTYDAIGRRVSRTAASTTTNFLFDGGAIVDEISGGSVTASYCYGNRLIRKDGEIPFFDASGNARFVTDSEGITAQLGPEAFGLSGVQSGSTTDPAQWGGEYGYQTYTDQDAGLVQVGARYYDPIAAGFITRDSMLSQAPYAYCGGDPVNNADPSGHLTWQNGLGILGATAGRALVTWGVGSALVALGVATAPAWITAGVVGGIVGGISLAYGFGWNPFAFGATGGAGGGASTGAYQGLKFLVALSKFAVAVPVVAE